MVVLFDFDEKRWLPENTNNVQVYTVLVAYEYIEKTIYADISGGRVRATHFM